QLFHDFLRSELKRRYSSEEIATLHSRAGQWYAENGLIEEALRHLFAAGDTLQALKLMEQHRHDLMNREQWQYLDRLLHLVPAEIHEKSPILLITKAWSCEFQSLSTRAYAYRDQAAALISQTSPESSENTSIIGEIDALRAHQYYLSAQGDKANACAQRALRLLPPDAHSIRGLALAYRAFALQMAGDLHQCLKLIQQALESESIRHDQFHLARLWFAICFAHFIEGNLPETKYSALRCLKYAEELDLAESTGLAYYFLGSCCYLQNKLPEALRYLAAVFDNPFTSRPLYVAQSGFALALIHSAQGDSEKAQQIAESVVSFATEIGGPLELELARAFMAELAYRQGRLVDAGRWAQHYNPHPMVFMARFYIPQLTQVKVLLAQNTAKTRGQAADLLAQIQDFSKSIHHNRILVDLTALQAMLLDQQGAEPAALGKLTEALALAQTGGFIRTFLDLGAPMADLLKRSQKQNIAVDYINEILAAFRNDEHRTVTDAANDVSPSPHHPISKAPLFPSSSHQPLVEPLTNRELDVLELLAQRFQNKEIAEKMFISNGTVKSHLRNIYG
ncbi:MAG: LuxR C-terminal-related transcriptional regulator, partial [Lysobacterales bacterium]